MKRSIHTLCICIFLFLSAAQHAHATSFSSAESIFTRVLASASENYTKEHDGNLPTTWSDLDPYFQLPIEQAFRHVAPTKRYAFLSSTLLLQPPHHGELFFMTRRPFRDVTWDFGILAELSLGLKPLGRRIVFRTEDGNIHSDYVSEEYIQALFKDHPSLLPTPDTEPARPHETKAYINFIIKWAIILLVIGAFLTYRLSYNWREKRARVKARAKADAAMYL